LGDEIKDKEERGNVECTEDKNAHRVSVGKPEGTRELGVDGRTLLKWVWKNLNERARAGLVSFRIRRSVSLTYIIRTNSYTIPIAMHEASQKRAL
jgi:hypothetical protein